MIPPVTQRPTDAHSQEDSPTCPLIINRRRLLGAGLAASAAGLLPNLVIPGSAYAALPNSGNRTLGFYNTHTDEQLKATYWSNGRYDKGALKDINYILRDHRNNEIMRMDVKLLDLLTDLHRRSGSTKAFQIVCGYRSPQTNAMLVKMSSGVAKNSLHMQGKAIDIRLADVSVRELRDTALGMRQGGVGYYPRSAFVHVDTGEVRHW
ncbi:DUF882 domain-containing protein [Dongia soli]|uniref:Murein endopeptidase K n=1 Tax=Dongia soli TaxID=600628 RepID=A0ABU5EDA6_9PROT|nr:DUF882 domain-containing protein [Dongia soli]MDY0884171.1 DUF882 domain-containing protein [Dongia soli]